MELKARQKRLKMRSKNLHKIWTGKWNSNPLPPLPPPPQLPQSFSSLLVETVYR